ncbi:hypothetical protein [Euryhalocaulis caribicus]|uniref:hypothetical protein n=1 Tax=Euryhalocaulis caribicus TaxID=1161401 RepID=UPI00039C88CE|nr:hypothetical protein [Euryhalocaulis caribicus]
MTADDIVQIIFACMAEQAESGEGAPDLMIGADDLSSVMLDGYYDLRHVAETVAAHVPAPREDGKDPNAPGEVAVEGGQIVIRLNPDQCFGPRPAPS